MQNIFKQMTKKITINNHLLNNQKYLSNISILNRINPGIIKQKYFFSKKTNNSKELNDIKESLRNEEKSILNRLSEKFSSNALFKKKINVVNHTSKEINPGNAYILNDIKEENKKLIDNINYKEYSRENFNIKNLKKSSEEEFKLINEVYNYQSENLSKRKYSIESINNFLEKLKQLSNINLFCEDKRFQLLLSDLLFITNDSNTAKELFHITFCSFLFNYYGNIKEFNQKVFSRFLNVIKVSEIMDILLILKYFKQIRNDDFVREGCSFVVNEINVRLDPNIYKRNKNILIDNDEYVNILITMKDLQNLEPEFINNINNYIGENLDSFSISELIEYSLFFVNFPEFQKHFLKFFRNKIYEGKLKRNMKNMSADKLYNISFILYNFKMFDLTKTQKNNNTENQNETSKNFDNFRTILETLLKNDSLNSDISEYLIIKNSKPDFIYDMVNLIIKIVENAKLNINNLERNFDPSTKNLIDLLFNVVFHYFLSFKNSLNVEQTFNLILILEKKKIN